MLANFRFKNTLTNELHGHQPKALNISVYGRGDNMQDLILTDI